MLGAAQDLSKTLDKGCVSWKELETSKYFHNLGRKACKYEVDSMKQSRKPIPCRPTLSLTPSFQ